MELNRLKGLLGIPGDDTSQDIPLQFVMDDVEETIRNYCNLDAVPGGLTSTSYRMAIDLYRCDRPGDGEAPVEVASISEGDIHQFHQCGRRIIRRYPEGLSGAA